MPVRIAYLVNQYPKVSHSFIRREIRAMESLGVEVDRYALRGWDEDVADPADEEERDATQYVLKAGLIPLLTSSLRRLFRSPAKMMRAMGTALRMGQGGVLHRLRHLIYLAEASQLLDWLDANPVAHLHAHFGTNSASVACLVRHLGGPAYSFTVHGQTEIEDAKALGFKEKVAQARFAVAVSQHGRSQLLREIDHSDWSRVHVVHCGLDQDFLDASPPPLPAAPHLVSVARLSEEKGHLILLPAIAQLRDRHPDLHLTLVGDGPMRRVVESEIARLGLQDAVTITGWVSSDRVREEIGKARLIVQPSFIEGLPVVMMEAMALARPVVATFVGGVPELVTQDRGWLVPAGDSDALEVALESALSHSTEALSKMGEDGRAAVRLHHDAQAEASKLLALIAPEAT